MVSLKKLTALLLSATLLSSFMCPSALAASKKKVGKINLTISSDIRTGSSGGNADASSTGSNTDLYYVDAVEVVNDEGEEWTKTNPPEIEITIGLEDEEEYAFSGTSSSNFKLELASSIKSRFDKIKFVKAKKIDDGATIVITALLVFDEEANISNAEAPTEVKWSTTEPGVATWADVASARNFQVQLFKDGKAVSAADGSGSTLTVSDLRCDLNSLITMEGSYQFKVRSIKSSNNAKSSWVSSDTIKVTKDGITSTSTSSSDSSSSNSSASTGWVQAADGRWWWKYNSQGDYPASKWEAINGQWYYFDGEGYMVTGWQQINGQWYYLANEGHMLTGWQQIGDYYYYLDAVNGNMYANCFTPDNYWVNSDGVWVQNP